MGALCAVDGFTVTATGGSAGSFGPEGSWGMSVIWDGYSRNYPAAGGGGGGGASGSITKKATGCYAAYAWGGMGGHNGGTQWDAEPGRAAKADCFALEKGMCTVIEGSFDEDDCSFSGLGVKTGDGGSGGWGGYASTAGKAVMVNLWPTSGTGTAESPYTISSAEEWNAFAANVTCGTT